MGCDLSRRKALKILAYSSAASVVFNVPLSMAANTVRKGLFRVPPLADAKRRGNRVQFDLSVQQGSSQFFPGLATPTLGYNGDYLGPLLRVRQHDKVTIRVKNNLSFSTTVHWHGMVLPAAMDGGPHQSIAAGKTWTSEFEVLQPAATLFYHSHAHHQTAVQVYAGLAGPLIIDDERADDLPLPRDYGVDDLPVIIQDRDFNRDGSFRYISSMHDRMAGKHGGTVLVNGVVAPLLKAQKTLLRLRLINASNARLYNLAFSDKRPFMVIASDGGMLSKPQAVNQLNMAPAERYEILVDVSDKRQLVLQSLPGGRRSGGGMMGMMGANQLLDVLFIDARSAKKSEHTLIDQATSLTQFDDWSSVKVAATRNFALQMGMMGGGMFRINGRVMDINRVDLRLRKNTFEIWNVGNRSPMQHPFHIHNTQFRVLSRNGQRPRAVEAGFKDTVIVNPRENVKILMPTGPYSDPNGYYMYHCHILEHEDGGMMGQFAVES